MAKSAYYPQLRKQQRSMHGMHVLGYACIVLGLSACSVASPVVESAAPIQAQQTEKHALPVMQLSPTETTPTRKASAEHCSVVDEKPERSSCFHHTPSGHGQHGHMCQPQSIPYARCRSQISSCNLGNTSPVELFNCEQKRGYTSAIPQAGALMSIGVNQQHHMSTGHTLYVEEVCPNADGTYKLRVSHTNYDRQCHLEEDVWVHYDPQHKSADFNTGHWAAWGKHLPIQGFILREPLTGANPDSSPHHQATPTAPHHVVPTTRKKSAATSAKSRKAKKK